MKNTTLLSLGFATVFAVATPALQAQDPTGAIFVEAESTADTTGAKVLEDGAAFGTSYTMHPKEYNPVFKMATPTDAPEYTVWMRGRGVALQLKAAPTPGASQKELKWVWKPGDDWTWKSFGRFTAEQLGSEIVIIRGKDPIEIAGLDAVILAPDAEFDPTLAGAAEELSEQ